MAFSISTNIYAKQILTGYDNGTILPDGILSYYLSVIEATNSGGQATQLNVLGTLYSNTNGNSARLVDFTGSNFSGYIAPDAVLMANGSGTPAIITNSPKVFDFDQLSEASARHISVVNDGTISTIQGIAFNASTTGSPNTFNVVNNGTVTADTVFGLRDYDGNISITNNGAMTSIKGAVVDLNSRDADKTVDITNTGSMTGHVGIYSRSMDGRLNLHNSGGITAGYVAIDGYLAEDYFITNTGSISGESYAVRGFAHGGILNNSGHINGDIDLTSGNHHIINSGSIAGDIDLGGDNDIFDGRAGTVSGTINGGDGNDIYIIDDESISLQEDAANGFDLVKAKVHWTLDSNFENLTLIGNDNFRGTGNNEANVITGNSGDNRLSGQGGIDTLSGGGGDDSLFGGDDDDNLYGNHGRDILRGGQHGDDLYGGKGGDVLYGGRNNDKLYGNNGDDVLIGGLGADQLFGGSGADTFVFTRVNHSPNSSPHDTIRDFEVNEDLIDLSGLNADLSFIGTTSFSSTAGEVRITSLGSHGLLQIDVDGDGGADLRILISGVSDLGASDLIL